MRTADYDFALPAELIAQRPAPKRDQSRLMVLNRSTGTISHANFSEFPSLINPGDVIVFNNSRVIPARLRALNPKTGGHFEILLLEEVGPNEWWVMMRPGKRARLGIELQLLAPGRIPTDMTVRVEEINAEGHRRLRFFGTPDILDAAQTIGEIPLPPYINRENPHDPSDRERYQTIYAQPAGSVAAPTAGLHFTEPMLQQLRTLGARIHFVTLHVGLGTFAPVKSETLEDHVMHEERYELGAETVDAIREAKANGRRVIAVGTTTVRVLESVAAKNQGTLQPESGRTRIFIHPPHPFHVVDALLTNFHLPCSTLLMLVSAFASPGELRGRELVLNAYADAVRKRYRFFSYGDAMLLL